MQKSNLTVDEMREAVYEYIFGMFMDQGISEDVATEESSSIYTVYSDEDIKEVYNKLFIEAKQ